MFKNIIATSEVNTGRQVEVDLVKSSALFWMIFAHTYETITTEFETSAFIETSFCKGAFVGPSAFIFCMGLGLVYSRRQSVKDALGRGWQLLTLGFLLQLIRETLPSLFLYLMGDAEVLPTLALSVGVDIMQFAGLAFLVIAATRKLKMTHLQIVVLSAVMSLAAWLIEDRDTGIYAIDQFLGYFWGTHSESYFPLFNWFIYVAVGQWFGALYRRVADKKRFNSILAVGSLIVAAAYIYVSLYVEQNLFLNLTDEHYMGHKTFPDNIGCLLLAIGAIGIFFFIGLVLPKKFSSLFGHPSRHINQYYCVSWVIIYWAKYCWFDNQPVGNYCNTFLLWIIFSALTIGVVTFYNKYLQERTDAFFARHAVLWSLAVWAIAIGIFVWAYPRVQEFPNFMNGYLEEL